MIGSCIIYSTFENALVIRAKRIIIINLKKSDTWKIQLTIANNFILFRDNYGEHVIHLKSDNI